MIYKIASLIDSALTLLELTGVLHSKLLPIGGGQLQQLGIIWGAADLFTRGLELLARGLKLLARKLDLRKNRS